MNTVTIKISIPDLSGTGIIPPCATYSYSVENMPCNRMDAAKELNDIICELGKRIAKLYYEKGDLLITTCPEDTK